MEARPYTELVVLMPVFNDWAPASVVCAQVARVVRDFPVRLQLLVIDDGSTENADLELEQELEFVAGGASILRLRRNLGHQRAIAVGLAYIHDHLKCDAVVVMDSDGEDRPEHLALLLREYYETGGSALVFAARGRRMEVLSFRALYQCYRLLHRLLTGFGISVGNFSLVPFRFLRRLVGVPELWSHYAASVFKSKIPYVTVRADRGKRLYGQSKMNLVGLVAHGLYALACFQEIVAMRVLMGSVLGGGAILLGACLVAVRHWPGAGHALPEWSGLALLLLAILVAQALATCFGFAFLLLSGRSHLGFLPLRDYHYFVDECVPITRHEHSNVSR